MSRVKTIHSRGGHEIEVVVRPPRKRQAREPQRPMFGGPESVIGERVQKDLDNALIYAALGEILNPQGAGGE